VDEATDAPAIDAIATEAPTVEVNVVVTEQPSEAPAIETETTPLVEDAGSEAGTIIAPLDTEAEALPVEEPPGNDVDPAVAELQSLVVERTEVEIERARLENERIEIENEALRNQAEHAAEDSVQEVGVTSDGRSITASDSQGSSETGHSQASSESGSASSSPAAESDGGSASTESKPASVHRSNGREPRTRRFKRGS